MAEAAEQLELSNQEKNDIQRAVDWTYKYAKVVDPLANLPESIGEFSHPERE